MHESFTKFGVTAELISAPSSLAFQEYLAQRGLAAESGDFEVMDEYPPDYSWVVYWISSPTEAERLMEGAEYQAYDYDSQNPGIRTLGVSVFFPAEAIYFPLKPTSVYGSNRVPLLLYILDHVSPEPYKEIAGSTEVSLYVEKTGHVERFDKFRRFFGGKVREPISYTKIEINAAADDFVDDLWISPAPSVGVRLSDSIYFYTWVWVVVLMVLCSLISALLAGLLVYRRYGLSPARFSMLGIFNVFTVLGVLFAFRFTGLNHLRSPGSRKEEPPGRLGWGTSLSLTAAFSAIFMAFTYLLQFIILQLT